MLKYLAKFASDILPSVAATIIGAYIVNHYITAKPADVPPATAAVSSTATSSTATSSTAALSAGPDSRPADTPTDVANIPAAGVRAKGISEKAVFDKAAAEKLQEKAQEKPAAEKAPEKAQDKSEDKPAETASISTDIHRRPAPSREKTAIRTIPLTAPSVQPAASAAVPANPGPSVEASVSADEHRDANDLARQAIERLRGENASRQQEASRAPDVPRMAAAPTQAPSVQPLPPPVMVAAPAGDTFAPGPSGPSSAQAYDPSRPVPPADIPSPQPLELRTDNNAVPPLQQHNKNVAEDMLSAAKSVFHAVLPQ